MTSERTQLAEQWFKLSIPGKQIAFLIESSFGLKMSRAPIEEELSEKVDLATIEKSLNEMKEFGLVKVTTFIDEQRSIISDWENAVTAKLTENTTSNLSERLELSHRRFPQDPPRVAAAKVYVADYETFLENSPNRKAWDQEIYTLTQDFLQFVRTIAPQSPPSLEHTAPIVKLFK